MAKKILIADDEPNVVKLIASRLKANKYDIIVAQDSLYAVQKAMEEKPDLIILDIKMPAGGGLSVFENLKMSADTMMIPIIFITAHPSEELRDKVMQMGAEGFIAKPFNADDLLAQVKKALGEDTEKKQTE
jgi:DNA-binding response OmpR family regulator